MKNEEWKLQAACRGQDPEWWFPEANDLDTRRYAMGVCETCPVRRLCAQNALDNGERFGIWAGVLMDNDANINRARRRQLQDIAAGADVPLDGSTCLHGHVVTLASLYIEPKRGVRRCRVCIKARRPVAS